MTALRLQSSLATVALSAFSLSAAVNAAVLTEGFESFTGGSAITTGGTITVVDTGPNRTVTANSTTENKIGNVSMHIRDTDTFNASPTVTFSFPAMTSGSVTVTVWVGTQVPDGGEFGVRLGGQETGVGTSTDLAKVAFNWTGPAGSRTTQLAARHDFAWTPLVSSPALNTAYTITMTFDTDTDTYSASVNGTLLSSGNFVNTRKADNISSLHLIFGGSTDVRVGEFFIDNVSVVPEPASLGVFGIGGLALLRRRRLAC